MYLACSLAYALPEGHEVASGSAEFHLADPKSLQITVSDKAILNYRKFNIQEGERVNFVQPSADSTVLNRVSGNESSQILGSLSANGKVFLINPNGVFIGPSAMVNAGSFLVSTLDIRDEDFLNEKYDFQIVKGKRRPRSLTKGS